MYFWLMNFQQENKAAVFFGGVFNGKTGTCRKPVLVLGAGETGQKDLQCSVDSKASPHGKSLVLRLLALCTLTPSCVEDRTRLTQHFGRTRRSIG